MNLNKAPKQIENLTLADEYLFEAVMQNKGLCKKFISTFLDLPDITDIEYINVEDVYQHAYDAKGVRFDVFVKDIEGVAYVIELQRVDTKEIEKRMRYYQSAMDFRQLSKGQRYKELKDNYVIFIMRDDLFGENHYKYTFKNMCLEIPGLQFNDGTTKVIFNAKGYEGIVNNDVKAFLDIIEGKMTDNDFVKEFQDLAEEIKQDETWRRNYMQSLLRDQDKIDHGFEQGLEQGHERGLMEGQLKEKLENAKNFIEMGLSSEQVAKGTKLSLEEVTQLKKQMQIQ